MTQAKVQVTTEISGFLAIYPMALARTHLRIANGVVEVHKNGPFWILISNCGATTQTLPNNMAIFSASTSPLALTEVPERYAC